MADWNTIKTEYITTNISYRALEKKYGINYKVIADKGKSEGWKELRSQHAHNTFTKILEADTEQKVSRSERLQNVADEVLKLVEAYIKASDPTEMDTQSMKHISGVLKDIKEVQRTSKDLEEQDARIANLRKQAEKEENQNRDVTITIEGGDPSWQT
jgi:hypothetical protein